jgi:hypothetical protein
MARRWGAAVEAEKVVHKNEPDFWIHTRDECDFLRVRSLGWIRGKGPYVCIEGTGNQLESDLRRRQYRPVQKGTQEYEEVLGLYLLEML